jgi:hypothetical protein
MKTCKNCGALTDSLYCGLCGQKPVPERITLHFIWDEFVHFFTHAEKGFFFTSWQLIKAPGHVIKSFIEGKRKVFQKPVSYYLIWIGLYSIVLYLFKTWFGENTVISFANYFGPGETTKFAISHLNIVLTLLLPVQAVYVYFLLMYRKYNYVEALVAILYAIGTLILFQTVFVVLGFIYYLLTGNSVSILWSDIFKVIYMAWVLIDLAKAISVNGKFVRILSSMLLMMATFTSWRLFISPFFTNLIFN